MTADLRPYPEYQDSGLPWLGKVPSHWQLRRAKYLLREWDRRWDKETGTLLSVSQYTGVTKRRLREGSDDPDTRASSLFGYKVAEPQNLVVNIMLAWNGSLGVTPCDGLVSPAYCVYRFRSGNPWFFHHLLRSAVFRAEIKRRSRGVVESRLRLYTDDLFRIPLPEPPIEEQSAIVRYLDLMDRRINRFIRNRRRLIQLLNEQKQAIINRAVTRGLDPNVPLKPSGIDWLGDIPQHWRIIPLKFLASRVQNGATPPTEVERFYESGTIPWYGPSSIRSAASVYEPIRLLAESAFTEGKARLLHGPAILIVVIGATAGRTALLEGEGATNQQITAYELLRDKTIPLFVLEQLRLAEKHVRATASTATIPILDAGFVSRLPVLIPPLTEQEEILAQLQVETRGLELAKTKAQREIDLIREYRTRLIADVVTGKRDVRHLAPLPEAMAAEAGPEDLDEGLDDEIPGEDEAELAQEVTDADD